jgi:hypothetical protein
MNKGPYQRSPFSKPIFRAIVKRYLCLVESMMITGINLFDVRKRFMAAMTVGGPFRHDVCPKNQNALKYRAVARKSIGPQPACGAGIDRQASPRYGSCSVFHSKAPLLRKECHAGSA